jgi:hypothetical protein
MARELSPAYRGRQIPLRHHRAALGALRRLMPGPAARDRGDGGLPSAARRVVAEVDKASLTSYA